MASPRSSRVVHAFAVCVLVVLLGASSVLFGVCGPFTDVAADSFCPVVLEVFYLGITTGTTATTYDPTSSVTRLQMATFLSRSVDVLLKRGSRRAALDQFWKTQSSKVLGLTTVGSGPQLLKSDGADIWVANHDGNSVSRVRQSDRKLLETWTGATGATGILVAMDGVLVTGNADPGSLYRIDPSQAPGAVTAVASNLGAFPNGIALDGTHIWTANFSGSVSLVTPEATIPWTVTTVTTGFSEPIGAIYDGANVWVTDFNAGTFLKLDSAGTILQTVTVGTHPAFPVFDGTNLWVPNQGSFRVSVVRASSGAVLQTLTGNGLSSPTAAAFDGERVLVTNYGGTSVSLWKAADLTPLGSFPTGSGTWPFGVCSDGVNFWITLINMSKLVRF